MDIREKHTYAAPIDEVWKRQTDAEYQKEKLTAIGNSNVEVKECGPSGDGFKLVIVMDVTADLPGFAAKVLPKTNHITQTYVWANTSGDVRKGTWKAESGTPVTATGEMILTADGETTVETINGTIKCGVPLIGGKIADFVGSSVVDGIHKDQAYTDSQLGG